MKSDDVEKTWLVKVCDGYVLVVILAAFLIVPLLPRSLSARIRLDEPPVIFATLLFCFALPISNSTDGSRSLKERVVFGGLFMSLIATLFWCSL